MAIRYDEMNDQREAAIARLRAHCGLPAGALPVALSAFGRDSQAGTAIAREQRDGSFTEADAARFRRTLARHPRIRNPELRLPDGGCAGGTPRSGSPA